MAKKKKKEIRVGSKKKNINGMSIRVFDGDYGTLRIDKFFIFSSLGKENNQVITKVFFFFVLSNP